MNNESTPFTMAKIKLLLHTSDEPEAAAAGNSFATSVKYPFCFATNRPGLYNSGGEWHSGHGFAIL
ncbi:hypothetical protein H7T43_01255 [Peribacillus simplex]|nr:hypothetical protein [Peribacillus simplex]